MADRDYLMRDDAPLTSSQWAAIDETVATTARRGLVGRRFIPVFGPVGAGLQAVMDDRFEDTDGGGISLLGRDEADRVRIAERRPLPLPILYKDFAIHWRDIETSKRFDLPLDTGSAAAAASSLAQTEDDLIFNGNTALGQQGLLGVDGHLEVSISDWNATGTAFADVVEATRLLAENGFVGPYALAVTPVLYAKLNRVAADSGVLEIEQIQKLMSTGVFRTTAIPENTAVVVSTGAQNMDLVIGEDMTTAYLAAEQMNHEFRVFETAALRIKQPESICVLR